MKTNVVMGAPMETGFDDQQDLCPKWQNLVYNIQTGDRPEADEPLTKNQSRTMKLVQRS